MLPTRGAVHAELHVLAKSIRKPEETPQQAYARAITQTAIGKSLFCLYQAIPAAPQALEQVANSPGVITAAHSALQAKAAEIRKAEPKLTAAQAFAKAYCDPANRALVENHNCERRGLPLAAM